LTSRLRVGILGAGAFASRRHLPELVANPEVLVVAACRRDREALTVFSDHFGIEGRYTDWRDMLDNANLDAVLIATPHSQHVEQTDAALKKGLHVLLEKPMAFTGSEARALRDLARTNGRVLTVAFNPPYWNHIRALRAGLLAGKIGDLETVSLNWIGNVEHVFGKAPMTQAAPSIVAPTMFRSDTAQNGGGQLMDGGGHLLSELLWVTGRRAIEVSAHLDSEPDDMRSLVSVKLEGDILASVTNVGNSRLLKRRIGSRYYGSTGTAETNGLIFTVAWMDDQGELTPPASEQEPTLTPVQDWLGSIKTGADPAGSADHAAAVTELLEAAYLSQQTGRKIKLPTDL
jgi:predicted dehydrogenase